LGTLVARGEAQSEEARAAAAAPPGVPDAMDVTIKAAEAETGTLYVAGEAPAGALLNIYANGELVGEARAGTDGVWLLEAEKEVPAGEVVLRVEAVSEDTPGPAAVAEVPFMRYPDGIVLEPLVTAESGEGGLLTAAASPPTPAYVIIRRGDNLWRIARRNYGRGIRYRAIYAANSDRIRNPNLIFPGQVFVIPTSDRSWQSAVN
jgi:nucleoid-associated protein YgaU